MLEMYYMVADKGSGSFCFYQPRSGMALGWLTTSIIIIYLGPFIYPNFSSFNHPNQFQNQFQNDQF